MSEELITPENISKEFLKAILDTAYMDTSFDSDNDLLVKEDVNCFIFVNDKKDRIQLLTLFKIDPEAPHLQRLECANKINSEYIMVRSFVGNNDSLRFTYDLLLAGGITKKAFVLAVKRFCSIPRQAVAEYGKDIAA